MCGKHDDQNCPDRHPELCKFWQSNDYKRNAKCKFLHVTITNEGDEKKSIGSSLRPRFLIQT